MFEQRGRREYCLGSRLLSLLWLACLLQVHLRSARRLCELCCANRGTFIKVGQHLGALDYLLPEEYTSTLKVLHSQAPQSSMQEVRQVIREDLGKEVPCCSGAGRDWNKRGPLQKSSCSLGLGY